MDDELDQDDQKDQEDQENLTVNQYMEWIEEIKQVWIFGLGMALGNVIGTIHKLNSIAINLTSPTWGYHAKQRKLKHRDEMRGMLFY